MIMIIIIINNNNMTFEHDNIFYWFIMLHSAARRF